MLVHVESANSHGSSHASAQFRVLVTGDSLLRAAGVPTVPSGRGLPMDSSATARTREGAAWAASGSASGVPLGPLAGSWGLRGGPAPGGAPVPGCPRLSSPSSHMARPRPRGRRGAVLPETPGPRGVGRVSGSPRPAGRCPPPAAPRPLSGPEPLEAGLQPGSARAPEAVGGHLVGPRGCSLTGDVRAWSSLRAASPPARGAGPRTL